MSLFLKLFNTTAEYNAYTADTENFILPNVSLTVDNSEVHYNPYVPSFFCKLILNNGETVELEGSGELTSDMISDYKSTLVSAEIGAQCTSIGNAAFYNCSSLTSIVIPNSVTSIGERAFYSCSGLTSIDIPNSVTSIGNNAFYGCSGLTSIVIPDSVTSIGIMAFSNCSSLTNCTIGSGVTSIDGNAFRSCSSLTSIISNATTAPTIIYTTFQNVKTGGTLTVPIGSSGYDTWMYYLGSYNWTKVEQ